MSNPSYKHGRDSVTYFHNRNRHSEQPKNREYMVPDDGLEPDMTHAHLNADRADARLVARMRLVLALAVLLAIWIEPRGLPGLDPERWPLFVAYGVYSLGLDMAAQWDLAWSRSPWPHRLDLPWYAAMVALTGGVSSLAFLFFLLPMLTASFRWGREEGGRVTLVSGLAFMLASMLAPSWPDTARLLLRSSFLWGLGYLCVHWGEVQVQLKRRLALLREVSQLSNPRFGVDRTLHHVLERTSAFWGASQCVLVLREAEADAAWMRSLSEPQAQALDKTLAEPLLAFEARSTLVHRGAAPPWRRSARTQALAGSAGWQPLDATGQALAGQVAQWLDVAHFISVPVALRQGRGRLYIGRQDRPLGQGDALFLGQLVAQAFPVIDHIELLDRMASDAAARERQKFALDLHDTAIQPYIGLRLALSALRHKVLPGNPLAPDLDKLEAMATRVTEDLRRYARQVRQHAQGESALLAELRRQAAQVRDFYGVDIAVKVDGELAVNDRLSAEVLQVVREGLANICKHTLAQRGEVRLQCRGGWLGIHIANEAGPDGLALRFTPRSISERAAALGGRAHVQHEAGGRTAVHIHIPV